MSEDAVASLAERREQAARRDRQARIDAILASAHLPQEAQLRTASAQYGSWRDRHGLYAIDGGKR